MEKNSFKDLSENYLNTFFEIERVFHEIFEEVDTDEFYEFNSILENKLYEASQTYVKLNEEELGGIVWKYQSKAVEGDAP